MIEFKQPGRNNYKADENPVLQAANVINAIRAGKYKHKGRPIPIANAEIPANGLRRCRPSRRDFVRL